MALPDVTRLRHMDEAAHLALGFAAGRTRAYLETDQMLLFALLKCLEIIGEAAANVSPPGRAQLPSVPWGQVVRMRNVLIHEYFAVDLDVVWSTVTTDLPPLVSALASHV